MKDLETVELHYNGYLLTFKFTGEKFYYRHNIGPKRLEEMIKTREEIKGRPILRSDHKNKVPDWCSYTRSEFIECKQSDTAPNAASVFKTWINARKPQVDSFISIYRKESNIPTRIKFAIHAGCWVTYWDFIPKPGKS